MRIRLEFDLLYFGVATKHESMQSFFLDVEQMLNALEREATKREYRIIKTDSQVALM